MTIPFSITPLPKNERSVKHNIMATENPTLILVHGGFHNPSCFYLIKPKLEALSYTVLTPHLPTSRGLSPTATLTDDVTAILEASKKHILP